ncbi:unnamed protein product [Effrenium voratum]|uniref:Uncharacterized protein n=1 Tax=Effrenium voratum TaxID=2562239 RepID=A0AA36JL60_9DINO|nr:unnamed protein product [Effrenium voratum]
MLGAVLAAGVCAFVAGLCCAWKVIGRMRNKRDQEMFLQDADEINRVANLPEDMSALPAEYYTWDHNTDLPPEVFVHKHEAEQSSTLDSEEPSVPADLPDPEEMLHKWNPDDMDVDMMEEEEEVNRNRPADSSPGLPPHAEDPVEEPRLFSDEEDVEIELQLANF